MLSETSKMAKTDILQQKDYVLQVVLILNCDGFSVFKSKGTSVWPILLSVVNLPPYLHQSMCNIILAWLWLNKGKIASNK